MKVYMVRGRALDRDYTGCGDAFGVIDARGNVAALLYSRDASPKVLEAFEKKHAKTVSKGGKIVFGMTSCTQLIVTEEM